MKIVGDEHLIFSTGKKVYTQDGVIGIGVENSKFYITEGYNGGLYPELTTAEKLELADYMIELWQRYKKELLK